MYGTKPPPAAGVVHRATAAITCEQDRSSFVRGTGGRTVDSDVINGAIANQSAAAAVPIHAPRYGYAGGREFASIHAANSSSVSSPAASACMVTTASGSEAVSSLPFICRNTSMIDNATRLLPSAKQ